MVDPTATHPVTGAKSTISTSGQPAHPTTGWSETAGAQRSSPTAKPQGSRHPTSTAVPTPNNYALTAATAPTTYLGFNDPRRQQRRCSCETQQYQDSCSQTDRFPEGGGDALSGLATILTGILDPYLLDMIGSPKLWVEESYPQSLKRGGWSMWIAESGGQPIGMTMFGPTLLILIAFKSTLCM